ncbi:hypothetical protein J4E81_003454 [Alternaria sp. BMP 2799]|nr:hypothetical protein J4E81_003454 [Alternaria sp. BMP 2799]
MIFAYALSHGDIELKVIPRIINGPSRKGCWKHRNWANPFNISLIYTCRQIHFETALLPYKLNVFVVFGNDDAFQDFFTHRTLAQLSMSLPEEQQEDTSSSMTSSEARPEEPESEEELNAITYVNATTSPLLVLPAELRNMIFEYAMYHETINLHLKYNGRTGLAMRTPEPRHSEPLLFVSRQITSEVALLPYKLNVFSINFHRYADLGDFLNQRTPDQLDLMVKVMCKLTNHGHQVHVASAAKWMAFLKEMLKKEA